MRKRALFLLATPLLFGLQCSFFEPPPDDGSSQPGPDSPSPSTSKNPYAMIETDRGAVKVEIFRHQAPQAAVNFLAYARKGFYDNTIVHFADPAEGIRAGRFTAGPTVKTAIHGPIGNESNNGLRNQRRYLAMLNAGKASAATSEFAIYTAGVGRYDYIAGDPPTYGRTVFGQVVEGMSIIDAIAAVSTRGATAGTETLEKLPRITIRILSVRLVDDGGTPPTIVCPGDVVQDGTGAKTEASIGRATISDADDATDQLLLVNDAPPDGFPVGSTLVRWWAMDPAGHTAECLQEVYIIGPGRPTLQCPPDVTVATTGDKTPVSLGDVTANDAEDGPLTPTNDAPTDGFPLGETNVTWGALDSDGFTVFCTQKVLVRDRPQIQCPADVTITATGEKTPVDLGNAVATDFSGAPLTPTNDAPAEGFAVGDTVVTWTATDDADLTATCTQTVHVRGTPELQCPPDITVAATGDRTAVDFGTATATDPEDGPLTPTNDAPTEGFPLGETVVTWGVMDDDGNIATCTHKVTVIEHPRVRVNTTLGSFVVELYPNDAPRTVENFLAYAEAGFYNGLIFHRVIEGFVVQGGGFTPEGAQVATRNTIPNEFGRSNVRGTVAMAKRGDDPNSATSQWFINVVDNSANLDNQNGGFTVFGSVVEGLDSVVDTIAGVEVDDEDRPVVDVIMSSVEILTTMPIVKTASGLQYMDFKIGSGAVPATNATVRVNYEGRLTDGSAFDKGNGSTFSLNDVVAGFAEGIRSMRVGGTRRLIIPPNLGYGANPPGGSDIPPNATLIFIVDLVGIEP